MFDLVAEAFDWEFLRGSGFRGIAKLVLSFAFTIIAAVVLLFARSIWDGGERIPEQKYTWLLRLKTYERRYPKPQKVSWWVVIIGVLLFVAAFFGWLAYIQYRQASG